MIQTIYITNSAENTLELDLTSSLDDHGLIVFNLEGLGSPKATVSGLTGPGYDGIKGYFARTDARHMVLTLAIPVRGDAEETAKALVYEFFPIKEDITFRIVTDPVGSEDAVDAYLTATVETVEMNQFAKVENAVISLYSSDPYFYDMLENLHFAYYGNVSRTILYGGQTPTDALITVTVGDPWSWGGDVSSMGKLTVLNDRGSQSMVITFVTALQGDAFEIDTRPGRKAVVHISGSTGLRTTVTDKVEPTSDWIKLYPGENNLSASITGTYQGPVAEQPDDADLAVHIPLNRRDGGEALSYHPGGGLLYELGGTILSDKAVVYPDSRLFVPADTAYIGDITGMNDAFSPTGDFTIFFWTKAKSFSNYSMVLAATDDANNGFRIMFNSSGTIRFTLYYDGSSTTVIKGGGIVDTWQYWRVWYNSVAGYIYAALDTGSANSQVIGKPMTAYNTKWQVGAKDSADYFDGQISALTMYTHVFSVDERNWTIASQKGRRYSELTGTIEIDVDYRKQYAGV